MSVNLAVLAYCKYLGFFAGLAEAASGLGLAPLQIILPLGISLFSFTQRAYPVDCQRGLVSRKQHSLPDFILFVTCFPHLVAGPILHHAEMMPQFDARPSATVRLRDDLFIPSGGNRRGAAVSEPVPDDGAGARCTGRFWWCTTSGCH